MNNANNANIATCAGRIAEIVKDHLEAAAEAYRALSQIEEGLKTIPALDFWARRELAEAIAAAAPGELSVAEARAGLEVARAGLQEGGRRKAAAQVLAAVLVVKTNGAPMGDERFGINIEAAHLTM